MTVLQPGQPAPEQTVATDWISGLVGAIGAADFPDRLYAVLSDGFGVGHVVVFTFAPNGRTGTMATIGRIHTRLAERLAHDYAEGEWFRRDPNLPTILAAGVAPSMVSGTLAARPYSHEYRRRFFDAAAIVDKIAFSQRMADGSLVYVNFHRLSDTGLHTWVEREALIRHGGFLTAALARHRQLAAMARQFHLDGITLAGLTPRERDVCRGILAGLSSQAIALHLGVSINTVLTLRRRAYARLGITSQVELLRLALAWR
jgi:DNA-binding CsgD family transcriptional regulator